jgi:hypothetical protein
LGTTQVRVRRERPTAAAWALALLLTMLVVFALTLGVYLNRLFFLCRLHLVCLWYISALLVLMTVEHRIDWTQSKEFTAAVAAIGLILFVMMLWRARNSC